jgi:hypothetical protein
VLVRSERDGSVVLGPRGRRRLDAGAAEGEDPLAPFGPHAIEHVRETDRFPHCPDLVVNGHYWNDLDEVAAFEELVGSHGGMGGAQSFPLVLLGQTAYSDSDPPTASVATRVEGASRSA